MGYAQVFDRIKAGGVLLLDGGTGTELERRGVAMNDQAWCAMAAVTDFDTLVDVHADYIARGADVITVNAYASSRLMLEDAGYGARFEEINRRACEAALTARDRSGRDDVLIAGSVSHMIPMQQGTQNSDPVRRPGLETIGAAFAELAALQKDCGCDLLLLEMMFDPPRMALAYEGAKADRTAGLGRALGALGGRRIGCRISDGRRYSFHGDCRRDGRLAGGCGWHHAFTVGCDGTGDRYFEDSPFGTADGLSGFRIFRNAALAVSRHYRAGRFCPICPPMAAVRGADSRRLLWAWARAYRGAGSPEGGLNHAKVRSG